MNLINQPQVKLETADEKKQQIMMLCLKQCKAPDDIKLLKIGSSLGDFVNNLRSALNYTMQHVVEASLKPALPSSEYKALKRNQDFPWFDSRTDFDKKDLVKHTRSHCKPIYDFLEGVQPYHQGNEWLRDLMRISNRDKHVIINQITDPEMLAIAFMGPGGTPHRGPSFFGSGLDRILVPSNPEPHVHLCPYYYYPYGMFAVKGGKWALFLVLIDQKKLGLTRFLENTTPNVKTLIDNLIALL